MFIIPQHFVQHVLRMDGEVGRGRLDRLPAILMRCEQRWGLTMSPPFAHLSFNYVAPATRSDGTAVIVKVCTTSDEFPQQWEALRLFDGHGMVQLLEYDVEDEVLVLECLQPGTLLSTEEDDEKATTIAANVMQQMWRPVSGDHAFATVEKWGRGFERLRTYYKGGSGPFPLRLLEVAERLFAELSASSAEPVLLHGDLHHENILAAQRQPWLAIDPKGLVGEAVYETGALLRNKLTPVFQAAEPRRVMERRVAQLADELGFEKARIRGWGLAQAVLSVWWNIEDSDELNDEVLACAELLAEMNNKTQY